MEALELQQQLFGYLKSIQPVHLSLADELAQLLNLSYDSVYRRIRGEKPLTLSELKTICSHYRISLDQVLQLQNDTILFRDHSNNSEHKDFGKYLDGILSQVQYFNRFNRKQLLYLCKDAPIFHFFHIKELASFKVFFWVKSIWNLPEYRGKSFSVAEYPYDEYFLKGRKIIDEYNNIPSVELWNMESINSTISQIKYYADAGVFASADDLVMIAEALEATLQHLEAQTELGVKFAIGSGDTGHRAPLKFYVNEIILGNNTILFENETTKLAFITHSTMDYISSTDSRFVAKVFANFNNLLSRSVLISESGEKERQKFFRTCREKIQDCKKFALSY
ncbi:MAG: helix-turn-helix domain-containing protein [Chitinophagaceae bacterium]|nr:helix-turn-helix domain-containing protein [Chitinophagaceae bacterium]